MGLWQDLFGRRRPAAVTAFVLGGGGNLGATQVGMLRALVERGVLPDVIVGCSVGAINGAALAADPTIAGIEQLERVWRTVDSRELAPPPRLPIPVQLVRRGISLHPNDGLRSLIKEFVGAVTFEQLRIPVHCLATSLETGQARWFTTGRLVDALLASSAIPAVFPPVVIDGERLIDGAAVADVPVGRAVEVGATKLYVLATGNLDRPRVEPRRPLDVAIEASWIARASWYHETMASLPAELEVVVVPGARPRVLRYHDFSHTPELIDEAYEAASRFLDGAPPAPPTAVPAPTAVPPVEETERLA